MMRQAVQSAQQDMAEPLEIRPFSDADAPAWEDYAAGAPDATFFHRLSWRSVVEENLGHRGYYRCAWRGDRLVAILPLIHVRSRLFGASLVSVAFGVYGGIVADDAAAARALAADAAALGGTLGVDHVELRHAAPSGIGWHTKDDFYYSFERRLAPTRDANLKAIPRKKRADLRKAIDNPALRVEVGADLDIFFRIYAESVRNLGTPVLPRRFYAAIAQAFGDAVEISAVHGPEGPVAALMTFYDRDRVMPYYGGATPAARPLHAYDLLYWSLMERAVARGATLFDFGRSKRGTGAYDYKTYWGFEPAPLHYDFHLVRGRELPEVNPLNPKYRLMIETWRRLPLPIANTIGPLIARQLG